MERQPCILCCYSGQDCDQLSGGGCLLLRCVGGVCTCGWKLTPTSFHLLGASQAVSAGQQRESPGLMHIATEQSFFFPLWNSGWCFSTWGPQAYSWGVMSSTKSFECSVFTFGSPRWPHQNQLPLHHVKPAFPFGLRSCSWQMNQCAISLKTNASPEFKERKMARELCGLTRW